MASVLIEATPAGKMSTILNHAHWQNSVGSVAAKAVLSQPTRLTWPGSKPPSCHSAAIATGTAPMTICQAVSTAVGMLQRTFL